MTKVNAEPKNDAITAFGDATEEEYTFLLVPVAVYAVCSQQARREQISVGEVFQKAVLQYLQAAEMAANRPAERQRVDRPEPAIVVGRKRRP
jgi:hypothetical protein